MTLFILVITIMYSNGRPPHRTEIHGYKSYAACMSAADSTQLTPEPEATVSTFCVSGS